jgi:protease IV
VDYVKQQLERAAVDDDVKAVLLKVDSPGGEVLASDDIYNAIKYFQDDHHKPVIAVMTGMAASGGYYVAAPCRWIVAHELTITGSIGVIMQGFNFRGLMDKVGVQPQVFKSGKFKDMMGSMRKPEEVSPEEEAMMQQLIDEAFGRFKTIVSDGRKYAAGQNKSEGRALVGNWADYADGRILTGKQAHEHGFVDELGSVDDAVKRALKIAGISNANLVRYQRLFTFANFFSLLGKSEPATIKVDVGLDLPRLEAGRMYFLPGHFLP